MSKAPVPDLSGTVLPGTVFSVRVTPRAGRNAVAVKDGIIQVSVTTAPEGGKETIFPVLEQGVRDISFANPDHDYPQRIRYWREGRLLMAETAMMDGSNAQNWTYAPAGQ